MSDVNDENRPKDPTGLEDNPGATPEKRLRPRSAARDESPISLEPSVPLEINFGKRVIQGGRPNTEDYAHVAQVQTQGGLKLTVGIVADGVGGNAFGEEASEETVKSLYKYIQSSDLANPNRIPGLLREALETANTNVFRIGRSDKDRRGMATTAVVAAIYESHLFVANVGDSRAYLVTNNKIKQLTLDHSWENDVVREGRYSIEETTNHPKAGELRRSIGFREKVVVDVGIYPEQNPADATKMDGADKTKSVIIKPGDRILLCSDGLIKTRHDNLNLPYVTDEEIVREISLNEPQQACNSLTKLAASRGVDDNASVVILEPAGAKRASRFMTNLPTYLTWLLGLLILAALVSGAVFFMMRNQANSEEETTAVVEQTIDEQVATEEIVEEEEPTFTPQPAAVLTNGVEIWPPAYKDFSNMMDSGEGLILNKDSQLVVANQDSTFTIENPFMAQAILNGSGPGLMGVVFTKEPYAYEVHCLIGSCKIIGDVDGEINLSEGQMSRVGASGTPDEAIQADYSKFLGLSPTVPTPTPLPTSTPTQTPIPTETPRPTSVVQPTRASSGSSDTIVPTATPLPNPFDLDLDGVIHNPENGQYDLCQDAPGSISNCGCPAERVPASCAGGGGGSDSVDGEDESDRGDG